MREITSSCAASCAGRSSLQAEALARCGAWHKTGLGKGFLSVTAPRRGGSAIKKLTGFVIYSYSMIFEAAQAMADVEIEVTAANLDGSSSSFRLDPRQSGLELRSLVAKGASKRGSSLSLLHRGASIAPDQGIEEQGITHGSVLTVVRQQTNALLAWAYTQGMGDEQAMEGITQILGASDPELRALPDSLEILDLSFFKQPLQHVKFPSGLMSLFLGDYFDDSLKGVIFPESLQTLQFGKEFNTSLKGLKLPKNLHTLQFGYCFDESLEGVELPSSLHTLRFARDFRQSLDKVNLPCNSGVKHQM